MPLPSPHLDLADDADLDTVRYHLHHVVEAGLLALHLVDPDSSNWSVPIGLLDHTVENHPGYRRGWRRVRDLVARVQEHVPELHEPDFDELEGAVHQAMLDASEAGWRLGLLMSRTSGVPS